MFRRGRKKEETSGSTTSSPRADTEDSKHSGNSLHKSIFAFHSSSKEKSTTSVDSGQGSGVAEKQAPAISSDEPATLPEATSLQPPGGHNPELLRNSNKSNGQSSVDGDEPLVIRGTDVQHSTSEQARGSRADTPPLKKQVITPADAPRFIRPISGVWDEAYKCLYDKNPDLIKEYQKCLLTQSDGTTLAVSAQTTATAFFGMGKVDLHRQMLRVIQLRTEGNEAKRWKLNFLGHELAVKNLVKPVVGIIEPAKDYVGAALDSSAIGSAAWAGVCLLLPLMLNPGQQEEARLKALTQVAVLLSQCKIREELYKRRYECDVSNADVIQSSLEHTLFKDYLRDLYVIILNFLATCNVYLSDNMLIRTTRSIFAWDGWAALGAEIQDQENALLAIETRFDAFKVQEERERQQDWNKRKLAEDQALGEEVHRIAEMMRDERRTQLLQWLTSVNIDIKYNDEREKHQEGTGAWLVNGTQFEQWMKTANSVLWLHGKAGAGKSNLSATAINDLTTKFLNDEKIVVAYFYFDFRDIQKQNAKGMVQSLIYQICKRKPAMSKAVVQLWDQYRHNTRAQEPGLKDDLLPALKESLVGFKGIYVVLDGLDECSSENNDLRTLLTTLNSMHQWSSSQLHLMLASRFISEIHERISPLLAIQGNVEIDLHRVEEVNEDIRKFVFAELGEHGTWSDAAKETVATALIGKAEGMFQYVTLQLQGPLRRAKTDLQRANALKNLPQGLNETYERALLSIPVDERIQAIRALKWLLASLRSLNLNELAEASRIDLDSDPILEDGTELDSPMGVWEMLPPGLVTLTPEATEDTDEDELTEPNDPYEGISRSRWIHWDILKRRLKHPTRDLVAFAHSSFPEYLRSTTIRQTKSGAKDFFISQEAASAYVTESCMAYHIHASKSSDNSAPDFPLWEYAAKYWMPHLENISRDKWTSTNRSVAKSILQPGSKTFLDMIRVLNPEEGDEDGLRRLPDGYYSLDDFPEPLYYVALSGHLQLLRTLLEEPGTQINIVRGDLGTALNAACLKGYGNVVQELLEHGADPWLGNDKYPCALAAAMKSNLAIVEQLVDWEQDIDLYSKCCDVGYSPLIVAAELKSKALVEYLLAHGIPVNAQGGYYGNALQLTAYKQAHDVFDFLLEKGADIDTECGQYGNALQAAATRGDITIIRSLLDKGADVNAQAGVYGTALQAASLNGGIGVVQGLLQNGAHINALGGKYGYALQGAAYMGHRYCAQTLLDAGASINAEGGFYGNALQAAFIGGERDMVNFLSKAGARVQAPGPLFEAALTRVKEKRDGVEKAEQLEKFQHDRWYFSSTDPAHSLMQNPGNSCWVTDSPRYFDPWMEWWKDVPAEWRTPW